MKITITGGAGFIGAHLVKELMNNHSLKIIDNFQFFESYSYLDYSKHQLFSSEYFINNIDKFVDSDMIFHLGACSDTMNNDGEYMFKNNYEFTRIIADFCLENNIKLVYSSSASVYGLFNKNRAITEDDSLDPKSHYAISKLLGEKYITELIGSGLNAVSFRFFNVFGEFESHKGRMASVIHKFYKTIKQDNSLVLFEGSNKIFRDFIYVKDVISVLVRCIDKDFKGVYNLGSGSCTSFQKLADIIIDNLDVENTNIKYIKIPDEISIQYQYFTLADVSKLSNVIEFNPTSVEDGVIKTLNYLKNS